MNSFRYMTVFSCILSIQIIYNILNGIRKQKHMLKKNIFFSKATYSLNLEVIHASICLSKQKNACFTYKTFLYNIS